MEPKTHTLGIVLLRLGLAFLFLWFGFSQLSEPSAWLALVPSWAPQLSSLTPATIIFLNAWIEIVGGLLLAFGIWTRWVALLLGLHLLLILADVGITDVGVRDTTLTIATFALSLFGSDEYSLITNPQTHD